MRKNAKEIILPANNANNANKAIRVISVISGQKTFRGLSRVSRARRCLVDIFVGIRRGEKLLLGLFDFFF